MATQKAADIAAQYKSRITTQDYAPKERIDGVEFVDIPHFVDDGGTFIEVARLTDGEHDWLPGVTLRQVSYAEMLPGATKGFHLHYKQDDVWFIPPSCRMLVVLKDIRQNSPTFDLTMRFVVGGGKAKLFRIPAGIAHGVRNIDAKTGMIFYFVSQQFDKENPDEQRLPWDLFGESVWEITKG